MISSLGAYSSVILTALRRPYPLRSANQSRSPKQDSPNSRRSDFSFYRGISSPPGPTSMDAMTSTATTALPMSNIVRLSIASSATSLTWGCISATKICEPRRLPKSVHSPLEPVTYSRRGIHHIHVHWQKERKESHSTNSAPCSSMSSSRNRDKPIFYLAFAPSSLQHRILGPYFHAGKIK
jgi:hypothetical protein